VCNTIPEVIGWIIAFEMTIQQIQFVTLLNYPSVNLKVISKSFGFFIPIFGYLENRNLIKQFMISNDIGSEMHILSK
jgi:hypothetical protein